MERKLLSIIKKDVQKRTTCTLTDDGVVAFEKLTKEYGLKHKNILDFVVSKECIRQLISNSTLQSNGLQRNARKSIVITKKSLSMLNESSKELGIPRDQIIDSGVRLLRALLQKERELTLEKHERAIVTLQKLSAKMLSTEAELEGYLDEDDPILSRLNLLITVMDNLVNAVENELKNNEAIDPDML